MAQKSNKTGAAKTKAHPTVGFGVPVTTAPHHFVVSIPRGTRQPVRITEDLGMHAQGEDSQVLDRIFLHRPTWTEIANPVKRLFNQRLKAHNWRSASGKPGKTRLTGSWARSCASWPGPLKTFPLKRWVRPCATGWPFARRNDGGCSA